MQAAAAGNDGVVSSSWAELTAGLSELAAMSEAQHDAENNMLNMIIMQQDVQEEQKLRHLQAAPPAAQPQYVNRIPVSPGGASSYNLIPGGGITPRRPLQLSKSVPSSPTFATSLQHMHHLLAGAAGRAGNPRSKDLGFSSCFSGQGATASPSLLAASLDLASCTSNLAGEALRSARCSGDHYPVADTHTPASCTYMDPDETNACNLSAASDQGGARCSATANFSGGIPNPRQNHQAGAKKRRLQHAISTSLTSTAAEDQGQSHILGIHADAMRPLETADMSTNNSPVSFNDGDESTMKSNVAGNMQAPITPTTTSVGSASMKASTDEPLPPAPKQDFIHVRARRGQATDSHSLAERVRREKISERMKFLQDLVPGCNKITGKAVMLDEIINYVQSLQRQVEFLSIKLSTMSPPANRYDATMLVNHAESQTLQQINQASMVSNLSHPHEQHSTRQHLSHHNHQVPMPLLMDVHQKPHMQKDSSAINRNQVWEDELQSLVQMGFPTTLS